MTMTVLDPALAAGDAGQVTGERQERPDPEVPERARRRTFTAQYKQKVLAAYDAAAPGEKGAILRREGLYSSLISEWRRARDAGALAGLKQPAGDRRPIRGTRGSPSWSGTRPSWRRSWPRPASWWRSSQKLRALFETISEGANTEPGRSPDRRGGRPARAEDRHQGGLPGGRGGAGQLVPAAPGQPGCAEAGTSSAQAAGPAAGTAPRRAEDDPGRAAQRAVR